MEKHLGCEDPMLSVFLCWTAAWRKILAGDYLRRRGVPFLSYGELITSCCIVRKFLSYGGLLLDCLVLLEFYPRRLLIYWQYR